MLARLRTVLLPAAAFAVLAPHPARAGGAFAKGPYLHALHANDVEIRLEIDPPQPVTIEVADATAGDAGGATLRVEDKEPRPFHDVHVGGLAPSHKYLYTVRGRDPSAVATGTFTTAPGPDAKASFTFLVYGDNRTDPVAHAAVVRAMAQQPGDFLVNTGDFVEDGRDPADWQSFFDVENDLLRDRCLFACAGNHELIDKAGDNYLRFFGPTPKPGSAPQLYGTFRWGNARFFLLNGQDTFTEGAEISWLRDALGAAENEPGLLWRFAVVHFGYRSAGPHGDNPRLLAAQVDQLLKDKKVDMLISGHDHLYERGEDKGMRYMVSGGGGAPLYRAKGPLASTRKLEATYHFVSFDVTPTTVKITAKRPDGSLLDACGFGHAPGWDCDAKSSENSAVPASATQARDVPASSGPAGSSSKCGCAAPPGDGRNAAGAGLFGALAALGVLALRRRFRYSRRDER